MLVGQGTATAQEAKPRMTAAMVENDARMVRMDRLQSSQDQHRSPRALAAATTAFGWNLALTVLPLGFAPLPRGKRPPAPPTRRRAPAPSPLRRSSPAPARRRWFEQSCNA